MPTLSPEILTLLAIFAPAMTAPTYRNALVLVCGAILAPGRRTVASALRVVGLDDRSDYSKYHRVLSRGRWSPMLMSRLLLSLLVQLFVPVGAVLQVIVDDTLERRRGRRIAYKGWFHDAVRSVGRKAATSLGIRWLCFSLLVDVPWSERPWALPFLVVPALSERTCQRLRRPHRSTVEWAAVLIERVQRWQPEREILLVGDGGYASVSLVARCQQLPRPIRVVARLRLDAVLHDPPGEQPKSKRGPKPKKGARQPSLKQRLTDPRTAWQRAEVCWYGGVQRTVEIATGVALWAVQGHRPTPLRWVLVRSPEGEAQPLPAGALLCSDLEAAAEQIVAWYLGRWNIEVTFQEMRAHLGFETQRQWSRGAIGRTTPCLLGLFSLVVALAKVLHPEGLPVAQSGWYEKEEATFSDVLAAVRRHLWNSKYAMSGSQPDLCLIPRYLWEQVQRVACYAA